MTFLNVFAQAAEGAAPAGAQQPGGMNMFLVMGLFMLAMWFLLIAPQQKKQKQHRKMIEALQPGDEIITSGGIYGTIQQIRNDRIVLKIADGTRIDLAKGFITSKASVAEPEKK